MLIFSPIELLSALRQDAAAAVALLVDVATRLALASQNEKSLAFDPVTVRLANYLIDIAGFTNASDAKELELRITQDDMAAAVGATRRSIAKDISLLARGGDSRARRKSLSHSRSRSAAPLRRSRAWRRDLLAPAKIRFISMPEAGGCEPIVTLEFVFTSHCAVSA